jgi:copper chaperone CopZ
MTPVLYGDADANPNKVHVDYQNNAIVVYFDENTADQEVLIDATMIVNPVAGVPTEWDFEKSMGAVRILIRR